MQKVFAKGWLWNPRYKYWRLVGHNNSAQRCGFREGIGSEGFCFINESIYQNPGGSNSASCMWECWQPLTSCSSCLATSTALHPWCLALVKSREKVPWFHTNSLLPSCYDISGLAPFFTMSPEPSRGQGLDVSFRTENLTFTFSELLTSHESRQ